MVDCSSAHGWKGNWLLLQRRMVETPQPAGAQFRAMTTFDRGAMLLCGILSLSFCSHARGRRELDSAFNEIRQTRWAGDFA